MITSKVSNVSVVRRYYESAFHLDFFRTVSLITLDEFLYVELALRIPALYEPNYGKCVVIGAASQIPFLNRIDYR